MADINLNSTTISGFLEADFDQIKDVLQDGGVSAVQLTVGSNTIVNGKLTVGSGATLTGNVTNAGSMVIDGNLNVGSVLTISNSFTTIGSGVINGNLNIGSDLVVTNNFTTTGSALIPIISGNLNIGSALTIGNSFTANGSGVIDGNLNIGSTLTITNNFTTAGSGVIDGDLIVGSNIVMAGQANSPIFTLTDGASITPNFDNGPIQTVTLGGDREFANPTNAKDGASYSIIIKQDTTGSRIPTWGTSYLWSSGTAPTLSLGSNAVDIVTFISDGTNLYGVAQTDFR